MTVRYRYTGDWITGGAQFFLLAIGARIGTAPAWRWSLAALAAVSFAAWIGAYRRYRQIDDLPTSRIASAAQGYVELYGRAAMLDGPPLLSRLSGLPCCWYRYTIERRESNNNWKEEEAGASEAHFLVRDDSGECVISPDGAEIVGIASEVRIEGDYRYTEWLILPSSPLYVLGELRTVGADLAELDARRDVNALIAEWKQDRKTLLARYDADGNGEIDLQEWEAARRDAWRAVNEAQRAQRMDDGVHLVSKPQDGRLYLIARERPERLGRRFRRWSAVHLAVFAVAGIAALLVQ